MQLPEIALFPGACARPAWPRIRHLDDIRDRVDPARGIHLFPQGRILLLRYVTALPETFADPLDLECRSLVFDRDSGDLLARPWHKFFNLGEREGLGELDLEAEMALDLKLDGTMVPAFADPETPDVPAVFTKGGLTAHARMARASASEAHLAAAREAIADGFTPIFEWTAPEARIVIAYPAPELRLLALRRREDGRYEEDEVVRLARRHGIPGPQILARVAGRGELVEMLARLHARTDIEGAVLRFPDGHRVKWKTADYHRRHRILAGISHERQVWRCWIEGVGDDVAAALGGERGRVLLEFLAEIDRRLATVIEETARAAAQVSDLPPAERAARLAEMLTDGRRALAFGILKGRDARDMLVDLAHRRTGSEEGRARFKAEFGLPDWTVDLQSLR